MSKRIISLLLLLALMLSLFLPVQAADRGVYLSTDSNFFAQLNLNTAGMEKIKTAVSAGNYTTAKNELLNYSKTKFAGYNPIPADSKDANRVFFAMNDTWSMQENRVGEATVKGTGFQFYSFGKTTNISGCYVLDILDRPDYAIQICTRENETASHRPVLKCYDASGNLISEVVASADAMIHKGKPDTNYGSDTVLYVKSGMIQNTDGSYLPYNQNSRRIYLRFNVPTGTKRTELVIYARLHGTTSSTESLPIYQFDSFNKSWTEANLTWNYLVKLKAMGHYSWKNIPGGFDWKQPEGVGDYDWLDSNSRFYELTALTQTAVATTDATQRATYFAKIKEILFDFIADTTVRTGFPANRDRESSSRMMNFPYIYKQLLAENVLTANENKTLWAYVYDELTFMDNGATIFDNTNGNHAASAYTNHSVYHLAGFYAALSYWPEFKNNSNWRKRYEGRVDFVLSTLINSDGSYNEVTFGYPLGVLTTNNFLIYCTQERGDTSAVAQKYVKASILLARYLMDCCYPNGKNPYWGEGSPGSGIKTPIQTLLSYLGTSYNNDPNVKALRYFIDNAEGTAPATVAQYSPVKIVSDRTGWSSKDSMFFMNAKSAGYHGHRDALAILYYYGGRSLLTDTGTTSASPSHPHYNFQNRSTRSHNTIEIDGKAQTWQKLPSAGANMGDITIAGNPSYSSVSSWTKANTNDLSTTNASGATVTHSTDFTHYRHVSYMKALGEILFVSDKVVPADSASHSYTQNWHSAPYSNPTIATDAYDTGRTNFASGANLLIAQVNGGSMTGSLQTGYDSSASATTTKYFQYQKSGSGTITYQTVLYPMAAGSTATVQPTKITMSGTTDATALASRIAVNDSSRPTVKTIYHYHAFEATPSARSFDAFTTNAGTVTLVQDGNGKLHFAALSKGASVSAGATVILKCAVPVTDLTATLENGILSVECSDPTADFATVTVNFSGQKVQEVQYNGNSVPFTQAADGTVTIPGQYPVIHFSGTGLLTDISQWAPHAATASIKDGTMTGNLSGADPYIKSDAAFSYPLQKGDIVEIRIKYNITSGAYSGLQFFWLTEDAPQYNGTNRLLHSATNYPANEYVLVRMNVPDTFAGDVMTGLRVDPVGTGTTNLPVGTYTIDYIYVGPASNAPSVHNDGLFFDFTDDRSAELRYTASAYNDRNYDTGNWHGNAKRTSPAYFDGAHLWYSVVNGQTYNYIQTSHNGTLTATSLSYQPQKEDWVQIRLRLENLQAVSDATPSLNLYYLKDNVSAEVDTANKTQIEGLETALNGQYVTLSAPLTESFTKAVVINALRVSLSGITNVSGKTGRVYLDYIAIGSADSLPVMPIREYSVTFKDAAGNTLQTIKVKEGGTAVYSGAAPTKAYDASNHYTFKGWDKALTNIQADTVITATYTATAHSYSYTKVDGTNHKATCSCGYSKTVAHTWDSGKVTTAATCTAAGVKTYTCTACKATKTESIAKLAHSYTYKATKNPTTSATGTLTGTCSKCSGTTTVSLPKLNTTDYTKTVTKAATCTATGTDSYKWKTTTYGSFTFTATTAALGHSYTAKVTAPTCTAQGYTTHTCSRCSDSYKDTYTNATGHSYTYKATKNPTTSATGTLTGTCSKCSGTTTVSLPKLNTTDYTKTVTKAATCTATGTDSYKWKTTTYGSFTFTATTAALGHSYTAKVTAPTCTAQGYTTHTCSRCSDSYKDTYTNATGHSYTYKATKNPTTSATGTLTGTCSKCSGTTTVSLPKLNTTDYTKTVTKAATCTATGTDSYKWKTTTYGSFTFTATTAALGHNYTAKVTAPTCTAQGYTTHTCSRCSDSYKDTYTNATGHSYTYKATKNPTTSATGTLTGTCSKCSGTTTVSLPKLNTTDYTKTVTKAATCTATGTDTYKWNTTTYGSFSFTATTNALGHSYTANVTAPTCTAQGYTTHTCSRCSDSYKDTYTNATGHSYTSKVTTSATCTKEGAKTFTCSKCNHSYTEAIAATGHTVVTDKAVAATCTTAGKTEGSHCSVCNAVIKAQETVPATGHSYTSKVTTAATCTKAGVKTFTCSKCNHSYTEAISATGHTPVTDKAVAATCTTAGKTEGSHCSVCNAVIKAQTTIPATGHSYSSKVTTAATCTKEGVKTYTCSKCSHSYTEAIAATGHTPVTDKAVAATCTTAGKTEGSHCSVCNAVLKAQETVPALGHDYKYTDNGDGTHTAVCARCEDLFTENHKFEDETCFCGAKVLTLDESIKIYHTLDLASDISITFAVPQTALTNYDSYYLEIVLPEYEGNTQTGTSTVQIQPVVNGNYYYFTLTGITAVRMGDLVDATLHMVRGTAQYISVVDSYSVATYAYGMLNSTTDSKMLTLCADLLRYGAEVQSFKGYRTDALVDAAMSEAQRSYLSDTNALTFTATDSYLGDLANPVLSWVGKTLDLGSKVGMKFVFNAKNYSGDIANLSMKVSYQGSNGEAKTVTLTGAEVYSAANKYYSFTFYGLLASELRTVVDVAVFDGNTQLTETLRYSAESYASKNTTGALGNLCKALFAYSDSAKSYFQK